MRAIIKEIMMKKIILILLVLCFSSITAYAQWKVVYRISSGEVVRITEGETYDEENRVGFSLAVDPSFIDGQEWLDPNYEYKVLGYAKIHDNGTVRNATQEEIDGFSIAVLDDSNQIEADKAIAYFQNNPQFRRIMTAYTDILIESELNKYRKWFRDFEEQMSLATSLANLQTRMAALCAANPMPDRELSQMRTQIINRISKDD